MKSRIISLLLGLFIIVMQSSQSFALNNDATDLIPEAIPIISDGSPQAQLPVLSGDLTWIGFTYWSYKQSLDGTRYWTHKAIDLDSPNFPAMVMAIDNGVVSEGYPRWAAYFADGTPQTRKGFGWHVIIDPVQSSNYNKSTLYAHLNSDNNGDPATSGYSAYLLSAPNVFSGQYIGVLGSSVNSPNGAHLHFQFDRTEPGIETFNPLKIWTEASITAVSGQTSFGTVASPDGTDTKYEVGCQ